ncbi:sigma-E processing peptidase SpoIIGA [Ammonifex thiophilus]|uniref:Sporulation sigma-E factor-processing peptidase n=1 Tax=Ammonifex thiophilus TaxID=444093 RepID=A0A3D8P578_9THEO|nr:sigma-E processing peptidase SpoIIGA [Ammonifex thiophilus]RDV82912.1 sigma-E processing peptidase SpoIIGA [Ammonifex thiophilus]
MAGYVVYVDELLATNLLMNYLILYLTGKLAGLSLSFLRLFLAALLGSLYLLVLFLPGGAYLYNLIGKFLLSFLIVFLAFGKMPWRRFLAVYALFFGVSFALGGVVFGVSFLFGGRPGEEKLSYRFLLPGLLATLILAVILGRKGANLRRRVSESFFRVPCVIWLGDCRLELTALVDTGNQLFDPVSGHPVMVVDYEALARCLPKEMQTWFKESGRFDPASLYSLSWRNSRWLTRVRLIPFRSLGVSGGLLVGLRPDAVEVFYGGKEVKTRKVVIGIYSERLSPEGAYQALLPPKIIEPLL